MGQLLLNTPEEMKMSLCIVKLGNDASQHKCQTKVRPRLDQGGDDICRDIPECYREVSILVERLDAKDDRSGEIVIGMTCEDAYTLALELLNVSRSPISAACRNERDRKRERKAEHESN